MFVAGTEKFWHTVKSLIDDANTIQLRKKFFKKASISKVAKKGLKQAVA